MIGLNLLMVGAVAETPLGDAPATTDSLSEGTDFAGVLETRLPRGESPTPDGLETPRAPDADATLAQWAMLGLMTLPTTPAPEPATEATHPTRTLEPILRTESTGEAYHIQEPPPFPPGLAIAQGATPKFDLEPTLGDGMGESDFPKTSPPASESLLAVEGDAPPVPARQAAAPPPPTAAATLATATSNGSMPDARPNASPAEFVVPPAEPTAANGESPTPNGEQPMLSRAPRRPSDEPLILPQEARLSHAHATASLVSTAAPAAEDAAPAQIAEPNWGAAEQIAHHIERMVYERERNRLTVRLNPPELGVVELRIQATGSEVQAWLTAERDLTRQMLQHAQQYLREQLESRGLQLTHFDVGAQSHFQHTPHEQYIRYTTLTESTRTPTATDSLLYDGRWSVWV